MPPARKKESPRKPPAAGKAPAPMTTQGAARGTVSIKQNQIRILERFLEFSANEVWGTVWAEVPEAEVCTQDFWGSFATYLSEVYVISEGEKNAGQGMAPSTTVNTWSGLLDSTKQRFSKSDSEQTKVSLAPLPRPAHRPATPPALSLSPAHIPDKAGRVRRRHS